MKRSIGVSCGAKLLKQILTFWWSGCWSPALENCSLCFAQFDATVLHNQNNSIDPPHPPKKNPTISQTRVWTNQHWWYDSDFTFSRLTDEWLIFFHSLIQVLYFLPQRILLTHKHVLSCPSYIVFFVIPNQVEHFLPNNIVDYGFKGVWWSPHDSTVSRCSCWDRYVFKWSHKFDIFHSRVRFWCQHVPGELRWAQIKSR